MFGCTVVTAMNYSTQTTRSSAFITVNTLSNSSWLCAVKSIVTDKYEPALLVRVLCVIVSFASIIDSTILQAWAAKSAVSAVLALPIAFTEYLSGKFRTGRPSSTMRYLNMRLKVSPVRVKNPPRWISCMATIGCSNKTLS